MLKEPTHKELKQKIKDLETKVTELQESEEMFRTIVERSNDGIVINDQGTILYANPVWAEMSGTTAEETVGKSMLKDFAPPVELHKVNIKDYFSNNNPPELVELLEYYHKNKPHLTKEEMDRKLRNNIADPKREDFSFKKDGTLIWKEISSSNMPFKGKKIVISIVRDATQRLLAEHKLKESEERYKLLFDHAGFAIILVDLEAEQITQFNKVAHESLGYSHEEFRRMRIEDIDQTPEESKKHVHQFIENGGGTFETQYRNKKGDIRDVLVSVVPLKIKGKLLTHNIINDITELKDTQKKILQNDRLATLGKLTATIAHELRNPLGTVRASVFSIIDAIERNEHDRLDQATSLADKNIIRCNNIIDALLEYSNKRGLKLSYIDIDSWLNDLSERLETPADITVETNLNAGISYSFDRIFLGQAISHLVINAVQGIQEEGSRGNTITIETEAGNNTLKIKISDNGIGMSEEILEKIWEPLFSSKTAGIGLGMPIVKNIVEDHGGTIDIQSKEGKGTTVTLQLPLSST